MQNGLGFYSGAVLEMKSYIGWKWLFQDLLLNI